LRSQQVVPVDEPANNAAHPRRGWSGFADCNPLRVMRFPRQHRHQA
jgi:hypothetical protein